MLVVFYPAMPKSRRIERNQININAFVNHVRLSGLTVDKLMGEISEAQKHLRYHDIQGRSAAASADTRTPGGTRNL